MNYSASCTIFSVFAHFTPSSFRLPGGTPWGQSKMTKFTAYPLHNPNDLFQFRYPLSMAFQLNMCLMPVPVLFALTHKSELSYSLGLPSRRLPVITYGTT